MGRPVTDAAILEFRLLQRMSQQVIMNVLHYKYSGSASTVVDGDQVAVIVRDQIFLDAGGVVSLMKTLCNNTWAYEGLEMQWIHHIRYNSSRVNALAGPGVVPGAALPQNCHQTLTKRAEFATKHGVGSFHLSGLSQTDVTQGLFAAPRAAAVTPLVVKLIEAVDVSAVPGALTMTPCILNKLSPSTSLHFASMMIQNTVRVQRRRTVGLGV